MKFEFHPSYEPALLFGISLQAAWLGLLWFCTYHIFPFTLIPTAAYCIITPIIIVRHPKPTVLDLQLVRTGYFFYCALGLLVVCAYAVFFR